MVPELRTRRSYARVAEEEFQVLEGYLLAGEPGSLDRTRACRPFFDIQMLDMLIAVFLFALGLRRGS